MIKEIEKIVEDMLPLKNVLPKEIVIGKLVFDYPVGDTTALCEKKFKIKERTKGSHSTYQVTYLESGCLKKGIFSTYKGQDYIGNQAFQDQIFHGGVFQDYGAPATQHITKEMIQTFIRKIADDNPIHRQDRALVPGLLLVNEILEKVEEEVNENRWTCRVRFIHPLFENEAYEFICGGLSYTIRTMNGKEILRLTLEEK